VQHLQVATILAADDPGGQLSIGFTLVQLGRPDDAIPRFHRAIELGADPGPARLGLGRAYLALGRLGPAREEYEALRALNPRLAARLRAALDAAP
jgi:Flp pilus assembly protein TadD